MHTNWNNAQLVEKLHNLTLRRNGTPPLFDALPLEINNENYFLLIGILFVPYL